MKGLKLHSSMDYGTRNVTLDHMTNTLVHLFKNDIDHVETKKHLLVYTEKNLTSEQAILYILNSIYSIIVKFTQTVHFTYEVCKIINELIIAWEQYPQHINWEKISSILRREITALAVIAAINELDTYLSIPISQRRGGMLIELHRRYYKLSVVYGDFCGERMNSTKLDQEVIRILVEIRDQGKCSVRKVFTDAFLELRTGRSIPLKYDMVMNKVKSEADKQLILLEIIRGREEFEKMDFRIALTIIGYMTMNPALITPKVLDYLNEELSRYGDSIGTSIKLMNRIRRAKGIIQDSQTTLAVKAYMNRTFAIGVYLVALDLEKFDDGVMINFYVQKYLAVWGEFPPIYELFTQSKEIVNCIENKVNIAKNLLHLLKTSKYSTSHLGFSEGDFNNFYTESEFSFAMDNFNDDFKTPHKIMLEKPLTKYKQYLHKCKTDRFYIREYVDRVAILEAQNKIISRFALYLGNIMIMYEEGKEQKTF